MIDGPESQAFNVNMFHDSVESLIWWLDAKEFQTAILTADRLLKESMAPGRQLSPKMLSKIHGLKGVALAANAEYERAIPLLREGLNHTDDTDGASIEIIEKIKTSLVIALFQDAFSKFAQTKLPIPAERIREIIVHSEDVLKFYPNNIIYNNLGHAYLFAENYFKAAQCFHTKINLIGDRYNAADLANLASAVGMLPGGLEKSKAIFSKAFALAIVTGDNPVAEFITQNLDIIEELHSTGKKIFHHAPPYDLSRN